MMDSSNPVCTESLNSDQMHFIQVSGLKKSYQAGKEKINALRGIDFHVNRGEIFGLIGPDGAGKTTLFRILTTLLLPEEGSAHVAGLNVVTDYVKIREQVGYMPGKFSLYQDLSVEENLSFFATLFNTSVEENYSLVRDIYAQLEKFRKRRAGALSGGMKQKLALCCALIHKPEVIFLDEPTTGVDAVSRAEFWNMLRNLQRQGITIVVSTPYMDEAERCDRIALIQQGRLMQIDTPAGIRNEFKRPLWSVRSDRMYKLMEDIRSTGIAEYCYPFGQDLHVVWKNGLEMETAWNLLKEKGHVQIEVSPAKAGIEDRFIELMNHLEIVEK